MSTELVDAAYGSLQACLESVKGLWEQASRPRQAQGMLAPSRDIPKCADLIKAHLRAWDEFWPHGGKAAKAFFDAWRGHEVFLPKPAVGDIVGESALETAFLVAKQVRRYALDLVNPINVDADGINVDTDGINCFLDCLDSWGWSARELAGLTAALAVEQRDTKERIAEKLAAAGQTIGNEVVGLDRKVEAKTKLAKALMILEQHPEWSDRKIATDAGFKSHASLTRNKTYQIAAALAREKKNHLPRGTKDGETGDIEAWRDTDEED